MQCNFSRRRLYMACRQSEAKRNAISHIILSVTQVKATYTVHGHINEQGHNRLKYYQGHYHVTKQQPIKIQFAKNI